MTDLKARHITLVCLLWGAAFGLIEAAFITRMNVLLPLGLGHLWLALLLAAGFSALAVLPAAAVLILSRWLQRPSPRLLLLSGPWFLLLVLAVSYYRGYGTATPRTLQGAVITILIALAMIFSLVLMGKLVANKRRIFRATILAGMALLIGGTASLLTASLPRLPQDVGAPGLLEHSDTRLRVLLIGLDGATWELLDPLIQQGDLPAFAELRRNAATGNLETVIPTFSPPIWTSIATGQRADDHGIYDHTRTRLPLDLPDLPRLLERLEYLNKPTKWAVGLMAPRMQLRLLGNTPQDVRVPRLWNILTQHDLSSIVLAWYVTHPAESIKGVLVSDRFHRIESGDPEQRRAVYPPELAATVASALVSPEAVPEEVLYDLLDADDLDEQSRGSLASVDPIWFEAIRSTIARDYTSRNLLPIALTAVPDWRLTAIFYKAVDNVHHLTWHRRGLPATDLEDHPENRFRTAIDRYYRLCDQLLAETLQYADENTVVVVVSDHGWDLEYPGHDNAPDGIFAIAGGPALGPNSRARLHIYDVAPTVLALLGLPVGGDMDGDVAHDLIEPAFWAKHPVRRIERYVRSESLDGPEPHPELDEEAIRRLQALGYLN